MIKLAPIKISARDLLSCYHLRSMMGASHGAAIEEAVKSVLVTILDGYRKQGTISSHNEEQAESALREMHLVHSYELELPPLQATAQEVESISSEITRRVHQVSSDLSKPSIEASAPENLPDAPEHSFELKITFDELKVMCPKDALIESAVESKSELLQQAIALVYSNVGKEIWGTPKARELVASVVQHLETGKK